MTAFDRSPAHPASPGSPGSPGATTRSTVVGVFEDRLRAEEAVAELERAGFSADEIGFLSRDGDRPVGHPGPTTRREGRLEGEITTDTGPGSGALTGAATGGVIGGIIGAAAALAVPGVGPVVAAGFLGPLLGSAVAGAAVGATGGGLVGGLVTTGVSEEHARYYDSEFRAGRTIVTVKAGDSIDRSGLPDRSGRPDRSDEAQRILRSYGAYDVAERPLADGELAAFEAGTIRVPIRGEEAAVRKEAVVTGEVVINKERTTEREEITDTVRRQHVQVDETLPRS